MNKKVVLITGASNGIGSAIAKMFAENDYVVAINYNKSKLNAELLCNSLLNCGYNAICVKGDVSNADDVKNMINELVLTFGRIDVLINNAGISSNKLLIDEDIENINNVIATNLLGTIYCSKECVKHMISQGYGKIINISSIWGVVGASMESVYSASKGGIIAFTKALAKELAYSNITVNAIAPGVVDTNMLNCFSDKEKEEIKSQIPLGRFITPKEIAQQCLHLSSDQCECITGQIIQIDGGYCI